MIKEKIAPALNTTPRIVLDAERAALGSALIEGAAARKIIDILKAEDFYSEDHRSIFRALVQVYTRDHNVDVVTLCEELRHKNKLAGINAHDLTRAGSSYLPLLTEAVVNASHVQHYSLVVKEASLDRALDTQLKKTAAEKTPENVRSLHEIMNALHSVHHRPIFDFRKDLHDYIEELLEKKYCDVIDTGFSSIDKELGGLDYGDVTVIGARTSGGKTAFMTKMCTQIAQAFKQSVKKACCLYLTTEMTEHQVVSRVMPFAANVDAWRFRKNNFDEKHRDRILAACRDNLSELPLLVKGKTQLSLADIASAVAQSRPRIVFIDYLQRCQLEDGDTRAYQIMDFMIGLKTLAQESRINIVIGCQLDRKLDKTLPEPENADLKDSGAIEAEADQVILLWKPSAKDIAKEVGAVPVPFGSHLIRAKISKNRHGKAWGRADFALNGAFINMAEHMAEANQDPDRRLPKEDLWT